MKSEVTIKYAGSIAEEKFVCLDVIHTVNGLIKFIKHDNSKRYIPVHQIREMIVRSVD